MLLEALGFLAIARLAILLVPFRRLASFLGEHMAVSPMEASPLQTAVSRQIGWAVQAVARRTPWNSNCLAQALAAKIMLRRRGIDSTLYLGVAKTVDKDFKAHAWLRSGDLVLTGRRGTKDFTVLTTFSEKRP